MAEPDREARDALDLARGVAAEAGRLLGGVGDRVGAVRAKGNPRDLVTEWDTRVEELIRERFAALTPGVPLLSEEAEALRAARGEAAVGADAAAGDRWVVDPIDGTVNFAHGLPWFAISIALERGGQAIAGVVAAPALGWEFHGCRGGGGFLGDRRLAVSRVDRLGAALLGTGFPYDRATSPDNNFAEWEAFQRQAGACRRFGAASLDLCLVARGWLDGYWERGLHPWDVAAGALLVVEAGGEVTARTGAAFASARGDAVASNGAIHRQMLDLLAAVDTTRRPT
jgi:myo-inositol-1(or 4)-monophosphatase